ncbi:restriction endonuclease subunit S [Mycoplasmopsis bovis]|nr:restriction endonuclease subunit S [Mycoplasmopsis bovis]TQF45763.1 restriction endonuclease subunit S [Mycoplasmopsis bovis]TQF49149.1 restriction endonuclease subunit S [Mycoplasmopsis bovis]TQF52752.1 restriction endonuclease subunit S [Mycoplasmopsis bovis]TQF54829.1 restriction endonuclease subunit S [Mycoplasmopsis bovis]
MIDFSSKAKYSGRSNITSERYIPTLSALSVHNNFIDYSKCYYVTLNEYKEMTSNRIPKIGDILLTKEAPVGRVAMLDKDNIAIGRRLWLLTGKENILDNNYLLYFLQWNKTQKLLKSISGGSTVKSVNINSFKNIEVNIHSYEEQIKIGHILSLIDKKINLNNKINDNLVKQAKLAYDYLFKNKQRNRSYNFDDQENVPLKDFCENIITGKTPPTTNESFFNGDIPFITIEDLSKSIFITKTHRTLSAEGANFQSNKFIPSGSLCVSCIATIGKIGFTTSLSQTNQQINSVIFPDNKYNNYIYFALEELFRNASFKTGNVFANLNKTEFSEILILKPSDELLLEFNKTTSILFKKIRSNSFENDTLYSIREKLLPLLMNGQVTIED